MTEVVTAIRTAAPADAALLCELARRTFLDAFEADNQPQDIDAYVGRWFSHEQIAKELDDATNRFYLADGHDAPLAYAKTRNGRPPTCVAGDRPLELQRLYVDKRRAQPGIGSVLMKHVIDVAHRRDHDTLWLAVWEQNDGARRFYARHGFATVGSQDFMMGGARQSDLVLQCLLS